MAASQLTTTVAPGPTPRPGRCMASRATELRPVEGAVTAGTNAFVRVGGNVSETKVTTGQHAEVSAHGTISGLTVDATGNAVVFADNGLSGSTIKAGVESGGSATFGSLSSISGVTVKAGHKAEFFAGETAQLDEVTTTTGDIDGAALGDLQGKFEAGGNVFLATYGAASGLDVTAKTGAPLHVSAPRPVSFLAGNGSPEAS